MKKIIFLFFLFILLVFKTHAEFIPPLYPEDKTWLKNSAKNIENNLKNLRGTINLETLTSSLEPVVVKQLVPQSIQKVITLNLIQKKINNPSPDDDLKYLEDHKKIHTIQINYLSSQLKIRYGLSEIWNDALSNEENLFSLDRRYKFKKDTLGNIVFINDYAIPQRELPGSHSKSYNLMKIALQKRIDYKESETPDNLKFESFRNHTIERVKLLNNLLKLIWTTDAYIN